MPKLFGTDGIRGRPDIELTSDIVERLGMAFAEVLSRRGADPSVVVGRDTRPSGPKLEAALVHGLVAGGATAWLAGILPTPAVAYHATRLGAPGAGGAVISASHNPADYNGLKFFGSTGEKISDEDEAAIEDLVEGGAPAAAPGRAEALEDAETAYIAHALAALEHRRLDGLRVVVDCANGAAFQTTPRALREAGATVIAINAEPSGANINDGCGSTYPEAVATAVRQYAADAGLALDGDADRLIAADEKGAIVDGDGMMAILTLELKEMGRLSQNLVVATVMSNLGFRRALEARGIKIIETAVGDRYVIEAMHQHRAAIGGEQSGHLIFTDFTTTGDGLITGLRLLGRMASTGKRLSELAATVERFPQVLLNVPVNDPNQVERAERIWAAVRAAEERLGDEGRILVRPSGTEPLVRVMVEATEEATAESVANEVAEVVRDVLGR